MPPKGFTLIEISIVLVIIGLLAGGILKGQQMIENAKYKAFVKEIDGLRTAFYTFQDRYKAQPGDYRSATTSFSTLGIPIYNGNGDGVIHGGYCGGLEAQPEEPCLVWQHLRAAGLIAGDPALIAPYAGAIKAAVGGVYQSISTGYGTARPKLLTQYIPGVFAQRLDDEFDDGQASTGAIVCYTGGGGLSPLPCNTADANGHYQDNQSYMVFIDL